MPRPASKSQLLHESQQEYEALEAFLAGLSDDQMIAPGALGDWSPKDVLAHLYEWQQMFFGWYEAGLRGETPHTPTEGYKWSQLPALNQAIYERYRDWTLEAVRNALRASHHRTLDLIQQLSDEALITPGLYTWMNKNTLIAYITANTSSHYRWARTEMRKRFKASRGG